MLSTGRPGAYNTGSRSSRKPRPGGDVNGADEKLITALYRELLLAWNDLDAEKLAAGFTEDGELIGFDGSQIRGRGSIESTTRKIFDDFGKPAGPGQGAQTGTFVSAVRSVRFLSPDAAVLVAVNGSAVSGKLVPERNAVQSMVAVRTPAGWRIAHLQTTPAAYHGRPDLAEALTVELERLLTR
jgi:uncharacterized protein (TIGR02246 family)